MWREQACYGAGSPGARLEIGNGAGISGAVIYCSDRVLIGERVMIGAGCRIFDTDFHSTDFRDRRDGNRNIPPAPVVIEDDVWLGAGVTVLKGVRIGKGSVVAAGSVVSRDIPAGALAAGAPARPLRDVP